MEAQPDRSLRHGIWAGHSSHSAVPIGDDYHVMSLAMGRRELFSVEGTYSGRLGFIYHGDDPINLYLYRKGKLEGYGPALIDYQVNPYPNAARVMGQFRSAGPWPKLPPLS